MTIVDIMKTSGMTKEQMAAKYSIPIRTLKSWIYGEREPMIYVLTMLTYIYMLEKELERYGSTKEELEGRIQELSKDCEETCEES